MSLERKENYHNQNEIGIDEFICVFDEVCFERFIDRGSELTRSKMTGHARARVVRFLRENFNEDYELGVISKEVVNLFFESSTPQELLLGVRGVWKEKGVGYSRERMFPKAGGIGEETIEIVKESLKRVCDNSEDERE